MSTPDNPDPADLGPDEDDAAIDEALQALTAGTSLATADEDEDEDLELGDDTVAEGDDDEGDEDDFEDFSDDDAADDTLEAGDVPLAADAPINDFEPGEEAFEPGEEEETEIARPIEMGGDVGTEFAPPPPAVSNGDERLARLEQLAAALITAENTRESGKVKRKVKASASGAAVAGFVPVVLQLVGVFDLDPSVVATLSAGVAALASFVSGYLTPEREPALDPVVAHKVTQPRHKQRRRRRK